MGQRHQLFVIAKINGRYRTLCAIHHQCLFGEEALERCLKVLKIFEDASNYLPIQEELLAARQYDDDFWARRIAIFHFPSLLPAVQSFYLKYDQGDNNNGITIFDITDIENTQYCFVDYQGMESYRKVDLMTPLSARTYLEAYYPLDNLECIAQNGRLLASFEGKPLIVTTTLRENWPDGDWQEGASEANGNEAATMSDLENNDATRDPGENMKTLRDSAMDAVLEALLDQPEQIAELVSDAELLADFNHKLLHKFYERATDLKPSSSLVYLLSKALESVVFVDLSPFITLGVEHLSELVAELRNGKMRVLSLSNLPDLSEKDLKRILDHSPATSNESRSAISSSVVTTATFSSLKAIVLMENPQISVKFLAANLGEYEVYHSDLFRRALRPDQQDPPMPTLDFVAPNSISQLVWVGLDTMQVCDVNFRLNDGQSNWQSLIYSDNPIGRREGDPIRYTNFPLDIPLPVGKFIHGLWRLVKFVASPKLPFYYHWSQGLAKCLATTSIHDDDGVYGVGPLSPSLYMDHNSRKHVESGIGKSLDPGKWALILVQEAYDAIDQRDVDGRMSKILQQQPAEEKMLTFRPRKQLRYAIVKALEKSKSSEPHILIADAPGYVDHVMGIGHTTKANEAKKAEAKRLKKWWMRRIRKLGDVSFYENEDIHDILGKIYP